jgi:nitrogen fixation protein NifB
MSKTISHESAKDFCASSRRSSGRVRLPIAPKAQARIRYSPDKPLPRALTPDQALNWLDYLEKQGESIKVVSITGPGDPLATPGLTLQTLDLLRGKYPDVSLCLTTLGFGTAEFARRFSELGLAHVSILMDAVDPAVAEKLYAWIRPGAKTLPLSVTAPLLIEAQAASTTALVNAGVPVQIKTTIYPGINSTSIDEIAAKAAELGVSEMKLFPIQARGDEFPLPFEELGSEEIENLVSRAAKRLPAQFIDMALCQDVIEADVNDPAVSRATLPKPDTQRPNLAVCSSDGFDVDLHLGQTGQYLIYGPKDGPVVLLEVRPAPEMGKGDARWLETALLLHDCFAVLASAAGAVPKRILSEKGLPVLTQEGTVEGLVDVLYGGGKKKGAKK